MATPFEVPHRYITELPPIAQQEIRRNFDEIGKRFKKIGGIPFIVVASDGTGDFLNPSLAIASVTVGVPTVIYIKNTGTNYVTTGNINISGKKIVLWGESPSGRYPGSGVGGPYWSLTSGLFTMSSATVLHVKGMMIDSSASQLGLVAGAALFLDGASLAAGGGLAVADGTTTAYGSQFRINATSYAGTINAWDSEITLANAAMTLTTSDLTWRGCSILPGGGSTDFTILYNAGSSGNQVIVDDCDFSGGGNFTVNGFGQVSWVGNTTHAFVSGGTLTSTMSNVSFTSCGHVNIDSTMWGTNLNINTATTVFSLKGVWYTATIAGSGTVCASFDGDRGIGSFPATLVTINGSHISGSIFLNRSTTNGVTIAGNTNVLEITGTNHATNMVNVTGLNNKIAVEVGAVINPAVAAGGNVYL